tara:strand:+ start:1930 stop:3498 length:1569 start_codon:yes stop_codon:yes gene_type:complete
MHPRYRRIIITGDVFRPFVFKEDPSFPLCHQQRNIRSLWSLLAPFASEISPIINLLCLDSKKSFLHDFEGFGHLNKSLSLYEWAAFYDDTSYFLPFTSQFSLIYSKTDLVLGFELPPCIRALLTSLGVDFINFQLHPVRFTPTRIFACSSNNLRISQLLHKVSISNDLFFDIAESLIKYYQNSKVAPNFNQHEKYTLFVDQLFGDASTIVNGKFSTISSEISSYQNICDSSQNVMYRPHPLAKNHDDLNADFLVSFGVKWISRSYNIYHLLSSPLLTSVLGLSSSVLHEAQFFNKESTYILPLTNHRKHLLYESCPVFPFFQHPQFWRSLLFDEYFPDNLLENMKNAALAESLAISYPLKPQILSCRQYLISNQKVTLSQPLAFSSLEKIKLPLSGSHKLMIRNSSIFLSFETSSLSKISSCNYLLIRLKGFMSNDKILGRVDLKSIELRMKSQSISLSIKSSSNCSDLDIYIPKSQISRIVKCFAIQFQRMSMAHFTLQIYPPDSLLPCLYLDNVILFASF